jgi:hypothetical protein
VQTPAIAVTGLRKAYGQVVALDDVSFQAVGAHQPVTALVNAERDLILGGPAAGAVAASQAWSAGILAFFAAIAALTYWHMDR